MTDLIDDPMSEPSTTNHVTPSRKPRAWRWVVASLVSIAMLLAMSGIAAFAQTGGSVGPTFVPATAIGYGEIRLDLPGDQHDELAAFMANFPGFADVANFDTKLNQALDQLLSSGSSGAATWTGNIQTWSNGQVALGLLALPGSVQPTPAAQPSPAVQPSPVAETSPLVVLGAQPSMVVALGVKDRAALETQVTTLIGEDSVSTEEYAGTTITTAGDTSYAITDQYLLVSPSASDIKTSLDVLAGTTPSLADDPDYQVAAAHLASPNLGEFYLSTSGLKPFIEQMLSQQQGGAALAPMLAQLPAWVGGYAQVSADHLTIGASLPIVSSGWVPSVRESDLAAHFPAGTLAYLEVRDLGTIIDALLGQLKLQLLADPDKAQSVAGLEQRMGPLDKLLDFVQDGALGISLDDRQLSAGIVATLSDPASGESRINDMLGLLMLLSGGDSTPYTIAQATVNGVNVTTITLLPSSGIPTNLPFEPTVSIAVSGVYLYLGLGDFAAKALGQDPATSLAADPRYATAVTEAGTPNGGVIWVDVAAAAPLVVGLMGADDASYETNVKPFVDAVDVFVGTATVDADVVSLKALLFVK